MTTKSRTEITVETHRILTIKRRDRRLLTWCDQCGKQVRMVTADEAAILARVSSRSIYVLIEARELRFLETPDGLVLICLNCLLN